MLITDTEGIIIYGLISAAFHEFGHLLCMSIFGHRAKVINFGFINADIVLSPFEEKKLCLILLSGCFVNFLIATVFEMLFLAYNLEIFKIIVWQNIGLGVFNLLPISNLDGGQIFYMFLKRIFNESLAYKVFNIVSVIFIIPVLIAGFYVLMNSKYNFSLFLLSIYLISYILFKEDIF